jgi:hypothetical protein
MIDNAKYKEFLECLAAGGDPLADDELSSAWPPRTAARLNLDVANDIHSPEEAVPPTDNRVVAGIEPAPEEIKGNGRRGTASPHCERGTAADPALHTPHSALRTPAQRGCLWQRDIRRKTRRTRPSRHLVQIRPPRPPNALFKKRKYRDRNSSRKKRRVARLTPLS